MNGSKPFPEYSRTPFERSERMLIDVDVPVYNPNGLKELVVSVELDGNLLNILIKNDFETMVNTTLIIPHIRGVSGIVWNGREEGYVFFVRIAGAKGFKVHTGWTGNQDYRESCKQALIAVRHQVLVILNEYYHRPYSGEQFKLF